jgi:hypothetical protein
MQWWNGFCISPSQDGYVATNGHVGTANPTFLVSFMQFCLINKDSGNSEKVYL